MKLCKNCAYRIRSRDECMWGHYASYGTPCGLWRKRGLLSRLIDWLRGR